MHALLLLPTPTLALWPYYLLLRGVRRRGMVVSSSSVTAPLAMSGASAPAVLVPSQ